MSRKFPPIGAPEFNFALRRLRPPLGDVRSRGEAEVHTWRAELARSTMTTAVITLSLRSANHPIPFDAFSCSDKLNRLQSWREPGGVVRRRDFIKGVAGSAANWPLAARAQQPGKLPTIGYLGSSIASAETQRTTAFVQRLRELGWIDGRNVAIEYHWAEGRAERFAEVVAKFVRLKVDIIVQKVPRQPPRQSRLLRPSRLCFRWQPTQSATDWLRAWRDLVATSQAYRLGTLTFLESGSNYCAKLSPIFAGWQSWLTAIVAALCWRWLRCKQRRGPWVSMVFLSLSGKPRILCRPSLRSTAALTHYMFAPIRL